MYFFHREENRVVETRGKSIKMLWEIWVALVCTLKLLAVSQGNRGFPVLRRRSTGSAVSPLFSNQELAFYRSTWNQWESAVQKMMGRLGLHAEQRVWKKL